ncbi:AI-2E family transporter [uncultured Limosilactobacillus sp.]|uniref:AI-2E family transporter n=1 Tax=uncultured Limosilactobacillus sp. TaxID=2837629 RepID=UPI0025CEDA19|nr:AI-2E family transporter [uncultured Limosilactobacillus sp.]
MKIKISRQHISLAIVAFILYLAIRYWTVVDKFLGRLYSAVFPLLLGAVVAYIVNLVLRQYERLYHRVAKGKALRFQRAFGLVCSYLTIIIILAFVVRMVIPELVNCIEMLVANHGKTVNRFVSYFQQNGNFKELWQGIDLKHFDWNKAGKYLTVGVGGTVKTVMSTASSIVSGVTTMVIAIFFSIYLLIFKEKLGRQCRQLLHTYGGRAERPVLHVLTVFDHSYSSYIVGQCKDAAILGSACFVGMKILRLPYASMIGVVTCFTALIPIIGAILGASVGVILIFAVSPVKALIFLIFILVLQQVDNRVTYPLVVGSSIGLPSVWVFAAVIIGGGFSGVIGMMLTVPLFAAIYRLVSEDVHRRQSQPKSSTEQ